MASYVCSKRGKVEINLENVIKELGPGVHSIFEIGLNNLLGVEGGNYSGSRLPDKRLVLDVVGSNSEGRLYFDINESSIFMTDKESNEQILFSERQIENMIKNMALEELVPGILVRDEEAASEFILSLNFSGVELLICLLISRKLSPKEIQLKSGQNARVFINTVNRLIELGIFKSKYFV